MSWEERKLRLVAPLDGGDLATVYRALEREHGGKACAVSVLHQSLDNLDAVAAKLQERVVQARAVSHPVKVEAEGVFTINGTTALVMEYVDGKDLERIVKREVLTGPVAAHIVAQLVELLIAAKQSDVAHGLLSPTRIRVQPGGRVSVLGLGGKIGSGIDADDPLFTEDRGARRYAAPEMLGGLLTSAMDVYAVGAILTYMVSGRWPKRPAKQARAHAVVADGASMSVQAAGVSGVLANMVKECMTFRPDSRPTLDEVLSTLRAEAVEPVAWKKWVQDRIQTATDSSELTEPDLAPKEVLLPGEAPMTPPSSVGVDMAEMPTALNESDEPVSSKSTQDLDEARTVMNDELATVMNEVDDESADVQAKKAEVGPNESAVAAAEVKSAAPAPVRLPPPSIHKDAAPPPAPAQVRLPPPEVDKTATPPLSVAPGDAPLIPGDLQNEIGDPDTVDQPTDTVLKSAEEIELDQNADKWDRMLGMHAKPDSNITKEWIRAARGQAEYSSTLYRLFLLVFVLAMGSWWMGWLDPVLEEGMAIENSVPVQNTAAEAQVVAPAVEDVAPPPAKPEKEIPAVAEKVSAPPTPAVPKVASPAPRSAPRRAASRTRRAPPPPAPAPAPEPEPTPTPAPQPAEPAEVEAIVEEAPEAPRTPTTAAIRVTGDAARVQLVQGTRRLSGGRIPPGTYGIEVVFQAGEAPQEQGQITLEAGQSAIINCKASFFRCTTRGPW